MNKSLSKSLLIFITDLYFQSWSWLTHMNCENSSWCDLPSVSPLFFLPSSYNRTKKFFTGIKNSRHTLIEDELLIAKPAEIWVEAHVGSSSCQSNKTSVILEHTGAPLMFAPFFTEKRCVKLSKCELNMWLCSTVKYDAPENITMSWLKGDLILAWTDKVKLEAHPALAEVRFRLHERPSEPWEYVRQILSTSLNQRWILIFINLFSVIVVAENGQHHLQQFKMWAVSCCGWKKSQFGFICFFDSLQSLILRENRVAPLSILTFSLCVQNFIIIIIFSLWTDQITVENLLEHTAYAFQIRYRSAWFLNPLWSDWSPVVTVPAGQTWILAFRTWSVIHLPCSCYKATRIFGPLPLWPLAWFDIYKMKYRVLIHSFKQSTS